MRNSKVKIGQVFKDEKRDLIITDREHRKDKNGQNRKWYKYACNKCNWTEGWIDESNLLNGNGCSCCANRTVVEGINDIPTTAPWMVKYFQGGYDEAKMYSKNSHKKIYPICPDCGRIKNRLMTINEIYNKQSISCICKDGFSYPSKFMFSVLEQLNLKFKTEYAPKWCKYIDFNDINKTKVGFYDFLLEDIFIVGKQVIIEVDGEWHIKYNNLSKQSAEESKYIDNMKDILAFKNGYEVIRIDCYKSNIEYIKNSILNSRLNELFDLSNIDWLRCEEFACSNLVKYICEIKKENSSIATTEISKLVNMNTQIVRKYLKKGHILNWCNYDEKEELKRSCHKNGKLLGKKVEIFKDNISLGVFPSCNELERQSEELFGIKLNNRCICLVCLNRQKTHKGFTFKYVVEIR